MTPQGHEQPTANDQATAGTRSTMVRGILLVGIVVLLLAAWLVAGRSTGSDQQLEAFVAADPTLVAVGAADAPVITSDDVTPAFFALSDMASPAEIRMAVAPLFDKKSPADVWIFANKSWADGTHGADLAILIDELKERNINITLILPPQHGETADEVIDAFANLSHEKSVTFLDYHDADKLGPALCQARAIEQAPSDDINDGQDTYVTQQMLLHMAINAPGLRPQLRLADIGARIERLKAETVCPGSDTVVPAALADDAEPETENVPAAPIGNDTPVDTDGSVEE